MPSQLVSNEYRKAENETSAVTEVCRSLQMSQTKIWKDPTNKWQLISTYTDIEQRNRFEIRRHQKCQGVRILARMNRHHLQGLLAL